MKKASCSAKNIRDNTTCGSQKITSGAHENSNVNRPTTRSQGATLNKGLTLVPRIQRSQPPATVSRPKSVSIFSVKNARCVTTNLLDRAKSASENKVTKSDNASAVKMVNENEVLGNQRDADAVENTDGQNANANENQNLRNGPPQPVPNVLQPNLDVWRHLLRVLVGNNLELPEFAGRDREDPEVFLRGCLETFITNRTEEHARVRLASRGLKDTAAL